MVCYSMVNGLVDSPGSFLRALATGCVLGGMDASAVAKLFGMPDDWAMSPTILRCIMRARASDSICTISRLTRASRKRLFGIARSEHLEYRNRRPTKQQVKLAVSAVVKDGLSIRQASELAGISRSAVSRYVLARRERIASRGNQTNFTAKQWRCPVHGPVSVHPCVACAAAAAAATAKPAKR